ncbi:RNA polymerase sigma-70 factor [Sphingobacterium faecium]
MKKDHEQALSALYHRYWNKLLVVAAHRLDDITIAEECVQDLFCSLWSRRHTLVLRFSLATYLSVAVKYQVIKQLDLQYRKAEQKEKYISDYASSINLPSADESILEKEMIERISAAINRLPDKCRIVFKLSREEGMPNKQIAVELGIAEKTVEAHISKALKELRTDLVTISPLVLFYLFEK